MIKVKLDIKNYSERDATFRGLPYRLEWGSHGHVDGDIYLSRREARSLLVQLIRLNPLSLLPSKFKNCV
jgi:hypothetical protein